jgi:hypothetical protein
MKKIIKGKDLYDIEVQGKRVTITPKIDMSDGEVYTRDEVIDALGIEFVKGLESMGGRDKDRKLTSLEFGDEWKPEDEEEGE